MSLDTGGPAFASECSRGMELRDWFAGLALVGLIASKQNNTLADDVRQAYVVADHMLETRKRGTNGDEKA